MEPFHGESFTLLQHTFSDTNRPARRIIDPSRVYNSSSGAVCIRDHFSRECDNSKYRLVHKRSLDISRNSNLHSTTLKFL